MIREFFEIGLVFVFLVIFMRIMWDVYSYLKKNLLTKEPKDETETEEERIKRETDNIKRRTERMEKELSDSINEDEIIKKLRIARLRLDLAEAELKEAQVKNKVEEETGRLSGKEETVKKKAEKEK